MTFPLCASLFCVGLEHITEHHKVLFRPVLNGLIPGLVKQAFRRTDLRKNVLNALEVNGMDAIHLPL